MQRVLENMPLLFTIGVLFPMVFYFAWGVIEIFSINPMPTYTFGGK